MTSFAGSEPPKVAVRAFRLVRDDCSRTPPCSSATSPDILGNTS